MVSVCEITDWNSISSANEVKFVSDENIIKSNLSSKPNGSLYKYVFDMRKLDEYIANYDTGNAQSNLYKMSEDMGCKVVNDDLYKFVTDNIEPTFTKKRPRSNKNNFPTNVV